MRDFAPPLIDAIANRAPTGWPERGWIVAGGVAIVLGVIWAVATLARNDD